MIPKDAFRLTHPLLSSAELTSRWDLEHFKGAPVPEDKRISSSSTTSHENHFLLLANHQTFSTALEAQGLRAEAP